MCTCVHFVMPERVVGAFNCFENSTLKKSVPSFFKRMCSFNECHIQSAADEDPIRICAMAVQVY